MIVLVLDGYNVIHAVPELVRALDRSLEASREALIAVCQAYRARRGDIARLYIVFDGDRSNRGPHEVPERSEDASWGRGAVSGVSQGTRGGVSVLFSRRPEDADERILQLIRADGGRSQFVIVSNDNYIFNNARVHGARVISVAEFYAQLRSASVKPTRSGRTKSSEKSTLPTRDAQQITEEYQRYLEGRR